MPDKRRNKLLLSVLGRSLMVVLVTLLGAIGGLAVGYYRAWMEVNPVPPAPKTMGGETAGVASMVIYAIYLAVGAVGGAIVGLVIGLVAAVFWPRRVSR